MSPSTLPIHELRESLTAALRDPALPNLMIKAPTGSGKSTQVPKFVLDSGVLGDKRVYVLQPRRIAARMLGQLLYPRQVHGHRYRPDHHQ